MPTVGGDRHFELAGAWSGVEPAWDDARTEAWLRAFLVLGVVLRVVRFGLVYPLWRDEAYVAVNLLTRDFASLTRPLDYQQVCPLGFLWVEKAISELLGFSEWSLRLLPTLAAIASLFLFRHVAGRLLRGTGLVIAVAFLAIAYTPIRHGGEIKPYATDFLVALGLIVLAVEWLRAPDRTRFLWALAAIGPLAIGLSNPAVFIVASVGLVLVVPVWKARSSRVIVPFGLYVLGTLATFLVLLRWVNGPQSDSVMSWMRVYWAGAFPPHSPWRVLTWLVRVHTSQMFAYPAGGDMGASTGTTVLVGVGILAYVRRGPRLVLSMLLVPFAFGLLAAFLGRYPYGGSARTMQYVAPSILLLAGLGAAVLIARLPWPQWRERAPGLVLSVLFLIGLGMMAWDVTHPYKELSDVTSRDFARRFWAEESRGAELVCSRTDLHLPLDALVWDRDRAALYLCYQALYSKHHHAQALPRLDQVSVTHPLRVVVFDPTQRDLQVMVKWLEANANQYELRSRHTRVLNAGTFRGKEPCEERYVVYELVPRGTDTKR